MNKLALMAAAAIASTGSVVHGLTFTQGSYPQPGYRTNGRGYRRGKSPFQARIDDMVRRKAMQTAESNAQRAMIQQLKAIG